MIRVIQIHPSTQPTLRTNRIRPKIGRLDYFGESAMGLHHQKSIPASQILVFLP